MKTSFDIRRSRPWTLAERAARKVFMPAPVRVRHAEYSMLFSADGAFGKPSERLIDMALAAIQAARSQDLQDIESRLKGRFQFPDALVQVWPGEHYKLLAGLVETLQPRTIVEIGTAEGMSGLALKKNLPRGGKVVTFDIIPWQSYPNPCLETADFEDGGLMQEVADLGDERVLRRYRSLLADAQLLFIDAAKDGKLEGRLIANLETIEFRKTPIVVFDDIRVWNMLAIWYELTWPKLDITSFGHWSGTGICELQPDRLARSS
jgi:predicted O-methyltransferase YrrM